MGHFTINPITGTFDLEGPGGGSPASPVNSVQFNDDGAFGGANVAYKVEGDNAILEHVSGLTDALVIRGPITNDITILSDEARGAMLEFTDPLIESEGGQESSFAGSSSLSGGSVQVDDETEYINGLFGGDVTLRGGEVSSNIDSVSGGQVITRAGKWDESSWVSGGVEIIGARGSSTSGSGGSISLTAGSAQTSGSGGGVTITAGNTPIADTTTEGSSGTILNTGGALTVTSTGDIVNGGFNDLQGAFLEQDGDFILHGGNSSLTGGGTTVTDETLYDQIRGGQTAIEGGTIVGANGIAGAASGVFRGGRYEADIEEWFGGDIQFLGGAVNGAGVGTGGSFTVQAGTGGTGGGTGGSISLTAGSAQGGDSAGGSLTFQSGEGVGTGDSGDINFVSFGTNTFEAGDPADMMEFNNGGTYGIFDFSAIADSNKTFSFLNVTGNVGMQVSTPASAAASGVAGSYAYDSSFFYICIGADTWKRTAISTW